MSTPGYRELTSRNWGFIPPELQDKLERTKILMAGCGLGSNLARDLVALGVTRFSLYDGDTVEYSNLGRQNYTVGQVGMNKVLATRENILRINPEVEVEAHSCYIDDLESIREDIESSDFVLNTVDYSSPVFLSLTDFSREAGKVVFFPTNIGWGAVLLVFSQDSISMAEYLEVEPGTRCDMTVFLRRLSRDYMPTHLVSLFQSLSEEGPAAWPSIPQIMPGAELVSALVCTQLCAVLAGLPVRLAPKFTALDLWPGGEA